MIAGCGGKSGAPGHAGAETTVVGSVRVAGNTPLEKVLIEPAEPGEQALEVTGDLREELKRLSGARVRVWGEVASGDRLEVIEYTILEISGRTPIVGVLQVEGGTARVVDADGEVTPLRDPPAALIEQAGAKVWVVLNADGVVIGYGVIREH